LIRPGAYCCHFPVMNCKDLDLVGDCDVEIDPVHHAIKAPPDVRISNTFTPFSLPKKVILSPEEQRQHASPFFRHMTPGEFRAFYNHTFIVLLSTLSLSRLSIEEKVIKLSTNDCGINCVNSNESSVTMKQCSVVSNDSASVFTSSKLYMSKCSSIDCSSAVRMSSETSEAYLTDCYVYKAKAMGVDMRRDSKYLEMNRCTVNGCGEQGVSVFNGSKKAKIVNCMFDGNCSVMSMNEGNVMFEAGMLEVRDSTIRNSKGPGLVFQAGNGIFDNLLIENSGFAGMTMGTVTARIANCVVKNANHGIFLHGNKYSGVVTLDNNIFTQCKMEIFEEDNAGQRIQFERIGGNKGAQSVASIPHMDRMAGQKLREFCRARRKGEMDEETAWQFSGCGFCQKSLEDLGLKSFKLCAACKVAQYCSAECQKKAWKLHKPKCKHDRECQDKAKKFQDVESMMKRWQKLDSEEPAIEG